MPTDVTLDKIVSLCKRRGFVYQSAEIYSGLNGVYDFGPLGAQLKQNIKDAWLKDVMSFPEDVVLFDGSLLGAHDVWKASGHVDSFSDPMIDCMNCKKRYRADDPDFDSDKPCPSCGVKKWTDVRQFRLMFESQLGAMSEKSNTVFLRPETAQSIFINFKNVMSSSRVKVPFGIAQVGKAFRNEITPKQFLFRVREFEQMELEFFCKQEDADKFFEVWQQRRRDFYKKLGLNDDNVRFRTHEEDELAHYAKGCIDVEYKFPFGWKELEGIANRSDYDLTQHSKHSGKDLAVFDQESKTSYTPHVIECSLGVDRLLLTLLFDAYCEEEVEGDVRTVLKLHPALAPVSVAVLPLVKKLSEPTLKLYADLKKQGFRVQFDESGSIGKRYRRHDEIGTPFCLTFDFDSLDDNCVTVRDRDSLKQERVALDQLKQFLERKLNS